MFYSNSHSFSCAFSYIKYESDTWLGFKIYTLKWKYNTVAQAVTFTPLGLNFKGASPYSSIDFSDIYELFSIYDNQAYLWKKLHVLGINFNSTVYMVIKTMSLN